MSLSKRVFDRYRDSLRYAGPVEKPEPPLMASLPLFSGLSSESMERLRENALVWSAPSGVLLLRAGEPADTLFVLLDGLVQVEATSGGRNTIVLVLRAPDCFFVGPVLRGGTHPISARALTEIRVLTLMAPDVRNLATIDLAFAMALNTELTRTCYKIMCELKSARTRSAFQRLVDWMLAMHDQAHAGTAPEMPYDKSVLAARLGMAPETLSRNLARLARLGVTIRGRSLRIKNPDQLRHLVESESTDTTLVP